MICPTEPYQFRRITNDESRKSKDWAYVGRTSIYFVLISTFEENSSIQKALCPSDFRLLTFDFLTFGETDSMKLYNIIQPTATEVPIVISSPHSGTYFPDNIKSRLKPEFAETPDDTDWFIDKLYDFAPALGITMITANYNRWVIDLNRFPQREPLYFDGRVITGLVPHTDFNGNGLYSGKNPDDLEIEQRLEDYFMPYHAKVGELLEEKKQKFGKALLFDAHSIRRLVPGIQKNPFPDLILGDNDLMSASAEVIAAAFDTLKSSDYDVRHNVPFKGGYITRSFGRPEDNIHALQLEMAKPNYMDDSETEYHEERAEKMRKLLQDVFKNLIATLA